MSASPTNLTSQDESRPTIKRPITYTVTPEGYVIAVLQDVEDASRSIGTRPATFTVEYSGYTIATEFVVQDQSQAIKLAKVLKYTLQYLGYTVAILLTSSDRSVPIPESLRKKLVYTIQYTGYAIQMLFQSSDVSRPIPDKLVKRLEYVITYTGAVVSTMLQSSDRSTPISKELFKRLEYTISYVGYVISMLFNSMDRSTAIAERPLTYNITYGPIVIPKSISESDQGSFLENAVIEFAEQDEWVGQENIPERQFGLIDANAGIDALYKPSQESAKFSDAVSAKDMAERDLGATFDTIPLRRFLIYDIVTGIDAILKYSIDEGELYELYSIPNLLDTDYGKLDDYVSFVVHEDSDIGTAVDSLYKHDEQDATLSEQRYDVIVPQMDRGRCYGLATIVKNVLDWGRGCDCLYRPGTDSGLSDDRATVMFSDTDSGKAIDFVSMREFMLTDAGHGIDARYKASTDAGTFTDTSVIRLKQDEKGSFEDNVSRRYIEEQDEGRGFDSELFDQGFFKERFGLAKIPYNFVPIPYPKAVKTVAKAILTYVKDLDACDIREGAVITSKCINSMITLAVNLMVYLPLVVISQIDAAKPLNPDFIDSISDLFANFVSEVKAFKD